MTAPLHIVLLTIGGAIDPAGEHCTLPPKRLLHLTLPVAVVANTDASVATVAFAAPAAHDGEPCELSIKSASATALLSMQPTPLAAAAHAVGLPKALPSPLSMPSRPEGLFRGLTAAKLHPGYHPLLYYGQ
eukprot:GHRR01035430.1.p1 GENE.GHRR01035430.1~~GHRR01035430.1.p1  ORF type:complete len:131 (-),score=48.09 GHRR01035430.1:15-407(-)